MIWMKVLADEENLMQLTIFSEIVENYNWHLGEGSWLISVKICLITTELQPWEFSAEITEIKMKNKIWYSLLYIMQRKQLRVIEE